MGSPARPACWGEEEPRSEQAVSHLIRRLSEVRDDEVSLRRRGRQQPTKITPVRLHHINNKRVHQQMCPLFVTLQRSGERTGSKARVRDVSENFLGAGYGARRAVGGGGRESVSHLIRRCRAGDTNTPVRLPKAAHTAQTKMIQRIIFNESVDKTLGVPGTPRVLGRGGATEQTSRITLDTATKRSARRRGVAPKARQTATYKNNSRPSPPY